MAESYWENELVVITNVLELLETNEIYIKFISEIIVINQ